MRTLFASLVGLIAIAAAPATAARFATPEAELAHALEGREAGKPVDCINLRDIRSSQIIDRTAIIYETSGRKLYVNRPDSGNFLRRDDILLTDTHSSQLCSIDIVRLIDPSMHMTRGSVGLGQFIPYTKIAKPTAGAR